MTGETLEPISEVNETTGQIIVCIEGEDWIRPYSDFGLTFESSETEILETVRPVLEEEFGTDIYDTNGTALYKIRKATNTKNLYCIPNSTAG